MKRLAKVYRSDVGWVYDKTCYHSKVTMFFSRSDDFSFALISFFTRCTGIWMYKNRAELYRRYLLMLYTCYQACFGIVIQTINAINSTDNMNDFIYATFLAVASSQSLFKMILMYLHRQDFFALVHDLNRKFLHSDYDTREQELVNNCKRLSAIGIGSFSLFTYLTSLSFMVTPLIDNFGKNESDRLLPFQYPINLPLSMTPYYEITFVIQFLMLYQIAACYSSFDYFLYLFNMHVATQFRILQYRLSKLNYTNRRGSSDEKREKPLPDASEVCYVTFRTNIQYHQRLILYCGKIEKVFSSMVLGEMLSYSLILTLLGIQLLAGDSEHGGFVTFICHLGTTFTQLLMFTYTCDGLTHESLNVALAIFTAPWYSLLMNTYGRMLRKDVTLVILKSRVPCCITAKGFFPISLETFTKVWTTTFSISTTMSMDDDSPMKLPQVDILLRFTEGLIGLGIIHTVLGYWDTSVAVIPSLFCSALNEYVHVAISMNNKHIFEEYRRSSGYSKLKMAETRTDDFSIALTSFFMKVIGFWVSADPVEQRRRNVTLTYTIVLLLFAVYVQTADFYYSKGDFTAYLFISVNILTVLGGLLKICVLYPHRKDFFSLVHHLQEQFLNSDYDNHEKSIVHRCTSLCTIFIGLLTLFAHLTAFSYAVSPLMANIGKNESNRVLPFKLWIDLPVTMTPYYEIAFTLEVLSLYQICVAYFCFDNFLCIMNLHVASQFGILQYRLTNLRYKYDKLNLLGDLQVCMLHSTKDVYVTFISYVHHHQVLLAYCKKLEATFNLIVLGDIVTFSLVICLNGVQALMTDSARRFIFLFFLLTSFVHLLMFTYSCDGVMHESVKVATGVYNSPWCNLTFNKYGRMLRKSVILIIMRANVPCYITARGFFPITLETYTKVWSTAASYFMLVRQTLDDMGNG
ncbi:uncharacterized protein LOC143357629 [Halictus rubicundus]|uniref:uncharacterized protein LOC143357629 n=1 Tax=Halictus rubicundus TaxID=77578 RepID=UPI004035D517